MQKLFKNSNFNSLFYSGLTSELGSFITETALMLFIFDISMKNKAYLGLARATFLVFLTLGGLLGGPLGEKYNRKKILIACEIFRIPAIIFLMFTQNIYTVILADAVMAFFTGIFRPSRQAILNEVVNEKQIRNANGIFASSSAALHLLGPLIGASAYAYLKGLSYILIFDLFTYVLGIILLSRLTYSPPKLNASTETTFSFIDNLKEGLSFCKNRLDLKTILINTFAAGLSIGIMIPLLVPFTTEVLKESESFYGHLMALFGLGGFFGGIISEKISQKMSLGKIACLSLLIEPIFFLIWNQLNNKFACLALIFIWGIAVFVRITSQVNHISDSVPTKYLTRIHSLIEMAFVVPNIGGGLLISLVGNSFSTMQMMHFASIIFVFTTFPRFYSKSFQTLYNYQSKKLN